MKKLDFFAGAEVDDTLYFSAWLVNGIFKMERNTGNITYIGCIDKEKLDQCLHYHVFSHQKKIYFIPGYGNCIAILDIKDLSIRTIELPKREYVCVTSKFAKVICVENALWMIPIGYDALLRLDLETEELEVYDNWPEGVMWSTEDSLLFADAVCVSGNICMLPRESKFFVTFDIETKTMRKWDWKYPKFAFLEMIFQNECIWFLPRADYSYIMMYSIKRKEERLIKLKEELKGEASDVYGPSFMINNKIIRAPYESEDWFIFDTDTNEIVKKKYLGISEKKDVKYLLFQKLTPFNGGVIATNGINGVGQFMSGDLQEIVEISFDSDDAMCQYILSEVSRKREKVFKENWLTIDSYVEAVSMMNNVKVDYVQREICGEKIYKMLEK